MSLSDSSEQRTCLKRNRDSDSLNTSGKGITVTSVFGQQKRMWFLEFSTWVFIYLWDSLSVVGFFTAAVCATLGYFVVVGLKRAKKPPPQSSFEEGDDMATSQNRFALLPDDDSGLTPEEVDEEMEKAKKLSLKSYEREKKRNRGRNENRLI